MFSSKSKISNITSTNEGKVILPTKIKCLGCRTYFIQSQILHLQNLYVEFKNYTDILNLDPPHQQIILRSIVAFLNTKGGTIYMGVEDKNCSVVGNIIARSKFEQFRIFTNQLSQKIYPHVDKKNNQLCVQYVPVMKQNGVFTGKYITKIIVKQGKTDTLYTIGDERILIQGFYSNNNKKIDIRLGCLRIGPGGISKLEGQQLLQQIYRRSTDPNDIVQIHTGCNPQPQTGDISVKVLGFRLQGEQVQPVAMYITKIFRGLSIQRKNQNYQGAKRLYSITFKSSNDTQKIYEKILQSQNDSSSKGLQFTFQGVQDGMYLFIPKIKTDNVKKLQKISNELSPKYRQIIKENPLKSDNQKEQTNRKQIKYKQAQQSKKHDKKPEPQKNEKAKHSKIRIIQQNSNPTSRKYVEIQTNNQTNKYKDQSQPIQSVKKVFYQFTHVIRQKVWHLEEYLKTIFSFKLIYHSYANSLLIEINTSQIKTLRQMLLPLQKQLKQYGFNGKIMHGIANGHIFIEEFDYQKREQFKDEIINTYLSKYKIKRFDIFPQIEKDIAYIDLFMDEKDAAASLDILIKNLKLRKYQNGKIKYMLQFDLSV